MTKALPDSMCVQIKLRAAQTLLSRPFDSISVRKQSLSLNFKLAASDVTCRKYDGILPVSGVAATELFPKARAQVAVGVLPFRPCALKREGITSTNNRGNSPSARRKRIHSSPLTIRVSDNQKTIIRQKADTAGISLGRYIRASALGSHYKPPTDPELIKTLLMLARELTGQGNNLNQIAKHLNSNIITQAQGDSMMDVLGRSIVKTLHYVRKALSQGNKEES